MSKNKNKSKKVPNGTIVQTRDEYFKGEENYRKPGYQSKGNYRKAVVVDSNKNDELALVKLTTSKKAKTTKRGRRYKPYILTEDDNLNRIKESKKFIIKRRKDGSIKQTIGLKEANEIKKESVLDKKQGKRNKKRLRDLKNK